MKRTIIGLFLAVCVMGLCGPANSQTGPAQGKAGSIGVSYDEGLGARYWVTDKIPVYASIFYWVDGARRVNHQPMNTFALKVGGGYSLINKDRIKIPAFLELRVKMEQDEVNPMSGSTSYTRYNQWSLMTRVGVMPELFITENFSLSYKIGLELGYHGNTYRLNNAQTGTQKNDDNYTSFGIFGIGTGVNGSDLQYIEALVVTFYF